MSRTGAWRIVLVDVGRLIVGPVLLLLGVPMFLEGAHLWLLAPVLMDVNPALEFVVGLLAVVVGSSVLARTERFPPSSRHASR